MLSKNFFRHEFSCFCGCGFDTADIEIVKVLQEIRDHYDKPLRITSGCRCERHNVKVKGHYNSAHKRGAAVDFYVEGVEPEKIYKLLDTWFPNKYKLGDGDTFTHFGIGSLARWRY